VKRTVGQLDCIPFRFLLVKGGEAHKDPRSCPYW
jgi:hypothetical protein